MAFIEAIRNELNTIENSGLWKTEIELSSKQGIVVKTKDSKRLINMCANNYLGLCNDPLVMEPAINAIHSHGLGVASVRFICGTQTVHRTLEKNLARWLGTEDSILFTSCWDANGGLFGCFLREEDVIISHTLNHASIIDGIRLTKARRYFYTEVSELEEVLSTAVSKHGIKLGDARRIFVCTDGVFSMDGTIAPLDEIISVVKKYHAVLVVDDSHGAGVLGKTGRGVMEMFGQTPYENFIYTGTLGKALGGASGGFVSGAAPVISLLRQKSRPYLFSNSLSPAIVEAANYVIKDAIGGNGIFAARLERLKSNVKLFKEKMTEAGFCVPPGEHAIVPVIIGDAIKSEKMAEYIRNYSTSECDGFLVISFSFPVVPREKARIRVQISALHSSDQLDTLVRAFICARENFL